MGIHFSMRGLAERYVRERRLDGNRCSSKRTRDEVDEDCKIAHLEHNATQDILDAFRGQGVGVEELEVRRKPLNPRPHRELFCALSALCSTEAGCT